MERLKSRRFLSQTRKLVEILSRRNASGTAGAANPAAAEQLYSSEKQTHFGFETTSEELKAKKVKAVFENVASRYDVMNDAMSFGIHRVWKDILIHRLRPKETTKLIDMAGGTGDIAFRFLKHKTIKPASMIMKPPPLFPEQEFPTADQVPTNEVEAQYQAIAQAEANAADRDRKNISREDLKETTTKRSVLVCDINPKMLEAGQQRISSVLTPDEASRISWLEADAENLSTIPSNTYDVYTIAFGIRNCVHIDKVLSEAYRILRPGGRFLCLEFSHVPNSLMQWAYDQYSFQIIPVMGQVIAGDWDSYMYLVQSIRKFPSQENFVKMIKEAGFRFVSYENLTFGVAAIHSGIKI